MLGLGSVFGTVGSLFGPDGSDLGGFGPGEIKTVSVTAESKAVSGGDFGGDIIIGKAEGDSVSGRTDVLIIIAVIILGLLILFKGKS